MADGFPGPRRYRDTFALAVATLFDHAAVFPDVAATAGVTLFDAEVSALERLRDALAPVIGEPGAEDAATCLADPRWPAVIQAATAAATAMQVCFVEYQPGVSPWREDPWGICSDVRVVVSPGVGVQLRVMSRHGDPRELSGGETRWIGELLLEAADALDHVDGVPVGAPRSGATAEPSPERLHGYAWIDPGGGLTMRAVDPTNRGFVTLTASEARWLGCYLVELAAQREPVASRLTAPYRYTAWLIRVVRYRFSGA